MKWHWLVLIILLVQVLPVSSENEEILVVYGSSQDLTFLQSETAEFSGNTVYKQISSLTQSDSAYSAIIFGSSIEFSTDDPIEAMLTTFAQSPGKTLVVMTPHVSEFGGSLRTVLGIDSIEDTYLNQDIDWTMEVASNFGNETIGTQYSYSGSIALVQTSSSTETLVDVITGQDEEPVEEDFPFTTLWNASNGNTRIYTSTLALHASPSQLALDQIPVFIQQVISQIITLSIQNFAVTAPDATVSDTTQTTDTTNSTATQNTQNSSESPNPSQLPTINLELDWIWYAILAVFLVFVARIRSVLQWLSKRIEGVFFLVIGAFYNVSSRELSHNEVVMNQSRTSITDFLEHVGKYGAHMREIKAITGLGSGSLLWHLQVLEDYGMVVQIKLRGFTVFLAREYLDRFDRSLKDIELRLQSKYIHAIVDVLVQNADEWISISELSELTDTPSRTLRRITSKLYELELIDVEKTPETRIYVTNQQILSDLLKSLNLRESYQMPSSDVSVT